MSLCRKVSRQDFLEYFTEREGESPPNQERREERERYFFPFLRSLLPQSAGDTWDTRTATAGEGSGDLKLGRENYMNFFAVASALVWESWARKKKHFACVIIVAVVGYLYYSHSCSTQVAKKKHHKTLLCPKRKKNSSRWKEAKKRLFGQCVWYSQ